MKFIFNLKEKLAHPGFQRYFKNTGWMFFGQMFSLLVAFFVGARIARYLGPENYGVLNYVLSFAGIFGTIASLGIDSILSREIITYPEQKNKLLGTGFGIKIFGGSLAFILASISVLLMENQFLIRLLVILYSSVYILQAINVISIYFQSEVKAKNNVKVQLAVTILSAVLKILMMILHKGVIFIVFVYIFDFIWQAIGFIWIYKRSNFKISNWSFDLPLAIKIWRNSWPLMLTAAVSFIYFKIDQVMIGRLMGKQEVGWYAAAVKIAEVSYFLPGIICGSLFPAIVNAKKVGVEFYHRRLKNFYLLMSIIPILINVPIMLLAEPIILILFGQDFIYSIGILKIYTWSSIGLFLGWAVQYHLTSENFIKTIFFTNLIAMITNIALNLVLIPKIGLYGSAYATLISYSILPLSVLILKIKKIENKIAINS
ncbi:MAG: Membrane protein [Parcubacteria group bacterium GW2011_GWE2_38_18]|nr:MAG: Membrane protein [Parcubacteria group bacterium GW2011_GWE2_38_18]